MPVTGGTTLCDARHCALFSLGGLSSLASLPETFETFENNERGQGRDSMTLTPVMEKFVDCWGEMGGKWGVNRTVAQAHAIFYLSPEPLNADDISESLSFSKSNVSTCLRELEGWGLVRPVHLRGDRRQYYEAIKDPWEMFRLILDERKRREIDPTVAVLRECLEESKQGAPGDRYTTERFHDALQFFELVIPLYDELRRLPKGSIQVLAKLRAQLRSFAGRP